MVLLIKNFSCFVGVAGGYEGQAKGRVNQEATKWIRNPTAVVWGGQTSRDQVRVSTQPNGPHSYSEVRSTLYIVTCSNCLLVSKLFDERNQTFQYQKNVFQVSVEIPIVYLP